MYFLNVFTNEKGENGTPLGIVEDLESKISEEERLKITKNTGFTEVVFIESLQNPAISIYASEQDLPFASHALVGSYYYFLKMHNKKINEIISKGNKIKVFSEGNRYYAESEITILPQFNLQEYKTASEIDKLNISNTTDFVHQLVWSWIDENNGLVRARTFAPDWDIPEDEANGSGSMLLSNSLNRRITVFHGKGSIIHAYPTDKTKVVVGGLVHPVYLSNVKTEKTQQK